MFFQKTVILQDDDLQLSFLNSEIRKNRIDILNNSHAITLHFANNGKR